MQTKPQIIKEILKSALGLFIFAIGVYLTIQANIGLAPWDCLSMGVSAKVGYSYGIVHTVISIIILIFAILGIVYAAQDQEKELPLIGTIKILK